MKRTPKMSTGCGSPETSYLITQRKKKREREIKRKCISNFQLFFYSSSRPNLFFECLFVCSTQIFNLDCQKKSSKINNKKSTDGNLQNKASRFRHQNITFRIKWLAIIVSFILLSNLMSFLALDSSKFIWNGFNALKNKK